MSSSRRIKTGNFEEFKDGLGSMNWSERWLLICGCGCILCILALLGTIAFGLVLSLGSDFREHRYCLDLTGCKELPKGGGDPPSCTGDQNGVAWATITVDTEGQRTVCIDIIVSDTVALPLTGLHIHGPLSEDNAQNAAIFVSFGGTAMEIADGGIITAGTDGVKIEKCVNVDDSIALAIITNAHLFYLNAHNAPFSNGALRDQLGSNCRGDNP